MSLHLGRNYALKFVGAPAVCGEEKAGLYFNYSAASMDWARFTSTFTPGPMVEVKVMCLM